MKNSLLFLFLFTFSISVSAQQINKNPFQSLIQEAEKTHSDGLVINKEGDLFDEWYFGNDPQQVDIKSITKSNTNLGFGILFTQNKFNIKAHNLMFGRYNSPICGDREEFHLLDFWVGAWDVYNGDHKVGTNKIEKILNGCALIENWRNVQGSEGISIFYYYPKEGRWKQVWVTENPFSNGGVKEKAHIETLENGSIRFQGDVLAANGTEYLDRTTLTPFENGHVEQLIEISADEGKSWREIFRGIYKLVKK